MKAANALKADLDAIDRALVLCGYEDDPKGIAPRGKYKQLFGRNELRLTVLNYLREAPADDETLIAAILDAKGWGKDVHADALKRVRDALQRAQTAGHVVQDFAPDGSLWRISWC